ncbi:MAG: hypothetical protein IPH31_00340 [Lewinellaceae bacterium]|nr:hypothetical protein [Lewinellaceae bacterium]
MKRLALFSVLVSFLFCYMEWGSDQSSFVYEVAYLVLFKQGDVQNTFTHPLILLPFVGELILLFLVFQKDPSKRWAFIGMALPGVLALFILLVGVLSQNIKIIASTMPFLLSAGWVWWVFRRN